MFTIVCSVILTIIDGVIKGFLVKRFNRAGYLDWVYYLDNKIPITSLKCL